ncbi:Alpha/Beta hydrolase protein [Aspergillus pseudodeflectus]|uniref:Carboxylic ester hydrolase n=1 Tax=Aspergillus pseudodeflectus TaxID=176178 RepID=A0ABR4KIY3_9EURO
MGWISTLSTLALMSTLPLTTAWEAGLSVNTTSGAVRGIYLENTQQVRAFLGIPYAEAPAGDLRWAPPERKRHAKSVLDATAFGSRCPQTEILINTTSEDCLSINIWTPSPRRLTKPAAVMLYIHGGGYIVGSGREELYHGLNIVRDHEDVIVVTFNYRLGIFGFPNAPSLKADGQNLGLLDQRLAVEWVADNIANFGGDPDRITLFGESAGASSTDLYSFAYYRDPIVRAAILQSGTNRLLVNNETDHHSWRQLAQKVGCAAQDMQCMRKVPRSHLIDAFDVIESRFLPVEDNVLVFENYTERAKQGQLAKIPTLIGSNSDEMAENPRLTSLVFTCPAQQGAEYRVQNNIPAWLYLYHGNFDGNGATHGSEIPLVFGTYTSPTLEETLASKYIQSAWVSFARNPSSLSTDYKWPLYRDGKMTELAPDNRALPDFTLNNGTKLVCQLLGMPITSMALP